MNQFAIKDGVLQSDMDCSGNNVIDATSVAVTENIMIGAKARLVAISNGVRLEVLNGVGAWIPQAEWTET